MLSPELKSDGGDASDSVAPHDVKTEEQILIDFSVVKETALVAWLEQTRDVFASALALYNKVRDAMCYNCIQCHTGM